MAESGDLTLGQYLPDWLISISRSGLEPTTLTWYTSAVTRHIIPMLGAVKMDRLSPATIEAFLTDKAENGRLDGTGGLGPASVRRLQVTSHKALDAAVRKGMLHRNPADLAESPKMPPTGVCVAPRCADSPGLTSIWTAGSSRYAGRRWSSTVDDT
ncbi:MAG: N-terminal phage integrase SAM-like domain-containing protein [Acidimicrobiia bacterium]|nr:N-terminal phage integrase SAM-like domain-containing protein [Acidimicrobiia bacterium]